MVVIHPVLGPVGPIRKSLLPDASRCCDELPMVNGLTDPEPLLVVWYNKRCPVCAAGINRQRNKLVAGVQRGTIAFRDINLEPHALATYGVSLEDIRRRLHATDGAGHLLIGADVAIALWRLTPGEGWLATLADNPVVRPITRVVYDRFADLLYAWNRRKGRW